MTAPPTSRTLHRVLLAATLAATVALGACGGTDAALLPIENPSNLSVRRLEITLRNMASNRTEVVKAPPTDAASPITFPTHVSFTFPASVKGYLEVAVDGFDATTKTAHGEGAVKIVKGALTEFPAVVLKQP